MEINKKPIKNGTVEITVKIGQEGLVSFFGKAKKMLGDDVDIPGFRKGKAPNSAKERMMDSNQVGEYALRLALEESFEKAVEKYKLDVANSEKLDIKENSSNKLVYTVIVHVYPDIELPDLSKISIKKSVVTVGGAEVEETLDVIRNTKATFTVKDGKVENGDRVEIDFKAQMDGKPLEGSDSKNHPLIIGGRSFMPGFEDNLIGMRVGESKEFSLVAPKDYYHKEVAGKKLEFSVSLNLVQSVQLPELNNEFASKLGEFKDVKALKDNIGEGLRKEKETKELDLTRLKALEKIAELSKLSIPEFLIEDQINGIQARFEGDLKSKGYDINLYLTQLKKSEQDMRKDWRAEAERQAKFVLILRAIAHARNITLKDEEVESVFNETAQAMIARGEADPGNLDADTLRKNIKNTLITQKALSIVDKECLEHV